MQNTLITPHSSLAKTLGFSVFNLTPLEVAGLIQVTTNLIYDVSLQIELLLSMILNLDIAFSLKYPFMRGNYLGKLKTSLNSAVAVIVIIFVFMVIHVKRVSKKVTFRLTNPQDNKQLNKMNEQSASIDDAMLDLYLNLDVYVHILYFLVSLWSFGVVL